MREGPAVMRAASTLAGITPACAGRTAKNKGYIDINEDHPRVCGKDEVYLYKNILVWGSPPRVREEQ